MTTQVLLVEDDVPLRRSLVLALADEGFAVREAGTGQEALAAAYERPDAIVLDLGLPDVDGLELCTSLRTLTANSILVHSVRRAHDDLARTLDAGADDYLTKPFPVADLADHLRASLTHPVPAPGELASLGLHRDGMRHDPRNAPVELTRVELHLLLELVAQRGAVVRHDVLVQRVWTLQPVAGRDVLEARLRSLRTKLRALGGPALHTTADGCRLDV